MLVGRDLGLPNLVVLVVIFGIFPAIGFVIRRKWLHAAARREEIKRLLILTSEEEARAGIEDAEGYFYTANSSSSVPSPDSAWAPAPDSAWIPSTASVPLVSSLKPPYQCAVCFSPTSTRCSKCKAVRYCSGRCQIVHWRQGHKDECRPYVAVKSVKVVSGSSVKEGDDEHSSEVLHHKDDQPEIASIFQSTSESSSEEYSTFSTPSRSSESSSGSSEDSDRMDAHNFADVTSDNFVPVKSEHQAVVSPARKSTSSEKTNQKKFSLNDEDTQPDDISNESSFSASTTSSGFWSGTIHSKKSIIAEVDNFELSRSSNASNENMNDIQSSIGLSSKVIKISHNKASAKGVNVTLTVSDDSALNGLGSKKSNDEIFLSNETLIDGLKSTRPPKVTSEKLKQRDVVVDNDLPRSMCKETELSPPDAGKHPTIKDSKAFGGVPSAIPKRSNHSTNKNNVTSPAFKSTRVDSSPSKASDTHVTSFTSRLASQSTKPLLFHVEENKVGSCSSKPTEISGSAKNEPKTSIPKVVDLGQKVRQHIDTTHRYSCKGLFSYETFVKLYNSKQVQLRPFGLINCGNSCYANAVLQCLMYTPPLNAYLLQGLHSKACDKRDWCFTCEFEGLVLKAKDGNSPVSPIHILSQIENIGSNLGRGKEEDAHEFLRYAIDTLQSVCLKEAKTNAFNSLEEETTLIGLTFGGYLRSKIKCMKCGGKSERHERLMDLTVEIEGDIGTLEEALNKFTCTETLDGENKYKCSRCKSYEKAKKKLTLLEAPNVLTIALKRFQSGKYGKLNKPIHFPEILDMAPYVSGTSDKSPVYRLYGVVVHVDVMNAAFSGHYVCYVKNVENRWFKIDDSSVKEVDLKSVLTKGAYMLLYARCSPRAPRLIRSLLLRHHHDPKKHKVATSFGSRSQSSGSWSDLRHDHLTSYPPIRQRTLEEESSSSDGSGIFSESCSCSTESSHRDSSSISWDWEHDYNSSSPTWRNMHLSSSDSDTSSSSSSFPSPLYHVDDQCRNLSCSSSCRDANFDRLGGRPTNLSESSKSTLRRSTTSRGKSD